MPRYGLGNLRLLATATSNCLGHLCLPPLDTSSCYHRGTTEGDSLETACRSPYERADHSVAGESSRGTPESPVSVVSPTSTLWTLPSAWLSDPLRYPSAQCPLSPPNSTLVGGSGPDPWQQPQASELLGPARAMHRWPVWSGQLFARPSFKQSIALEPVRPAVDRACTDSRLPPAAQVRASSVNPAGLVRLIRNGGD